MSHKATVWAIQQRGLKPAAKIVLWHLCDRFHPDHGCFPSQETLANDCEMSRAGLNLQLNVLARAGLIRREQRRDENTNRQRSTRYRLAFEDDFEAEKAAVPCPETGHGAVSKNEQKPCPKKRKSRVQTCGHKPVIEPVTEPLCERELAKFDDCLKAWPSGFADSRKAALEAWDALSPGERTEAAAEIPRFVANAKAIGRKHICSFAAYLAERRWTALPDKPKPVKVPPAAVRPVARTTRPTAFQLAHPELYPELHAALRRAKPIEAKAAHMATRVGND